MDLIVYGLEEVCAYTEARSICVEVYRCIIPQEIQLRALFYFCLYLRESGNALLIPIHGLVLPVLHHLVYGANDECVIQDDVLWKYAVSPRKEHIAFTVCGGTKSSTWSIFSPAMSLLSAERKYVNSICREDMTYILDLS